MQQRIFNFFDFLIVYLNEHVARCLSEIKDMRKTSRKATLKISRNKGIPEQ